MMADFSSWTTLFAEEEYDEQRYVLQTNDTKDVDSWKSDFDRVKVAYENLRDDLESSNMMHSTGYRLEPGR